MAISQRGIVEIPFNLPQGVMNHPAIVLSCNDAIEMEGAFTAVMITSQQYDDECSFELHSDMLNKPLNSKYSEVRLHLISFFKERDVIRNSNHNLQMKEKDFLRLIAQINRITFGINLRSY